MKKIYLVIILASAMLVGCAHQKKVYIPLSKVTIPSLDKAKSRIFFHRGGQLNVNGFWARVINADNNELVVAQLYHNDCTYSDINPGNYKFRADFNSSGSNKLVTEISVEPGKTYYMMWLWVSDRRYLEIGPERGAHLLHLKPEQGEKVFSSCNYKATRTRNKH